MEFARLNRQTLKELFVEEIESMILSGKLPVGTRLPPERELAETMQVSRSVVNSGINEMAAKGFLEIRPRMGTYVADFRRNGTIELLQSIMQYNGGRLQREEIRSILEMKRMMDSLAARKLAEHATEEDLAVLRERLDAMGRADGPEQAAETAFAYYHELALRSDNSMMPLIYYSFKVPILSLFERFCRKYGDDALYLNAKPQMEAIAAGDGDRAVAVIEQSIGAAIDGDRQIYED